MKDKRFGNKAKGIIDGLEDQEEKSKRVTNEKRDTVNNQTMKRSFLLSPKQVERIYMLKAKNSDKTLSAIVGEAIDEYYERLMVGEEI